MPKILTIVGARPQFIKAATVSRAIRAHAEQVLSEVILHTGQHFDANMSKIFFDELDIPKPNYNLSISGLSHGAMTGRMIEKIEAVIVQEAPDWVLVYGDTNSTLAAALAAAKMSVPIAHVEAGLRSHNPEMPEEINRVLTDRVSTLLFCPSQHAMDNLRGEGFPFRVCGSNSSVTTQMVLNVGDVMFDAVLYYRERAVETVSLQKFGLESQKYTICTIHRQENTDDQDRLAAIISALNYIAKDTEVVMPLHPRTRASIAKANLLDELTGIKLLEPLSYLEMLRLQMGACVILTDSGGLQKEAYFNKIPCITLRNETEWVETVNLGWNQLVGANTQGIIAAYNKALLPRVTSDHIYGDGSAAQRIIRILGNDL